MRIPFPTIQLPSGISSRFFLPGFQPTSTKPENPILKSVTETFQKQQPQPQKLPRTPSTAHPRTRITIFTSADVAHSRNEPIHYYTRAGLREGLERLSRRRSGRHGISEEDLVFIFVEEQELTDIAGMQQSWTSREIMRKIPSCPSRLWKNTQEAEVVALPRVTTDGGLFLEIDGPIPETHQNSNCGLATPKLRAYVTNTQLRNYPPPFGANPSQEQSSQDPFETHFLHSSHSSFSQSSENSPPRVTEDKVVNPMVVIVTITYPASPSLTSENNSTEVNWDFAEKLRRYYCNEFNLERLKGNRVWIALDLLSLSGTANLPPIPSLNDILHPQFPPTVSPRAKRLQDGDSLLPIYATKTCHKLHASIKKSTDWIRKLEGLHGQVDVLLKYKERIMSQQAVLDRLCDLISQVAIPSRTSSIGMGREQGGSATSNRNTNGSQGGNSHFQSIQAQVFPSSSLTTSPPTFGPVISTGSYTRLETRHQPSLLSGIGIAIGTPTFDPSSHSTQKSDHQTRTNSYIQTFGRNISGISSLYPPRISALPPSHTISGIPLSPPHATPDTSNSDSSPLLEIHAHTSTLTHIFNILNWRISQVENTLSALKGIAAIEQKRSISTGTCVVTLVLPILVVMGLFMMVGWQGPMWVYPVIGLVVVAVVAVVVALGRGAGI